MENRMMMIELTEAQMECLRTLAVNAVNSACYEQERAKERGDAEAALVMQRYVDQYFEVLAAFHGVRQVREEEGGEG